MTYVPLGDRAWLVRCPDEATAIRLAAAIRAAAPEWLEDAVPSYATVGVFYDQRRVAIRSVETWLINFKLPAKTPTNAGRLISIPVCYERGPDLKLTAEFLKRTSEDVIREHVKSEYTVYAIGFVPGFPYLGYLPKTIANVPRLASPRTRVEPGSVGITGNQTGIYPMPKPGGWHLIGRTPLTIVDPDNHFFPISVGDRVKFVRIDEADFTRREGERLAIS